MTQFSLEDGSYINADHVISYAKLRNGKVRFTMVNEDTILGKPYDEDFEEAFYPIIPAQPGYETVFARKRDGIWFYNAQPVVAWRECLVLSFRSMRSENENPKNMSVPNFQMGSM